MFRPSTLDLFMGGTFDPLSGRTVGELRQQLQAMDSELATWGDATAIQDIHYTTRGLVDGVEQRGPAPKEGA